MSIIQTHDITLQGGNDKYSIVLRPMSDADIPLLVHLNRDPEVLQFVDDDSTEPYTEETVKGVYGYVSPMAYCFIVEVNGQPVGDCWLQKMNEPEISALYPEGTDVRRIDMSIGESSYHGKGIGTMFVGMLIDFAFRVENVEVLHCQCNDDNIRSKKVWEHYGFHLAFQKPRVNKPGFSDHYVLTREEYWAAKTN